MKPDFKNININAIPKSHIKADYKPDWETVEHINVKPAYTAEDLENMEHLNYAAGIAPYLRGPYSTMYVMRPWTVRQYAGFSTAEESNAFYRRICQWHSTLLHTVAMTLTMNALWVMSVRLACQSAPSRI